MADLTVFPIPIVPNNYNKLGKKIMIHDLTQPESTSTKLIDFQNIISTQVTYNELVDLITNNQLIPGGFYLLIDFQTVYDQMDFDAGGALKSTLTTKTGAIEQIWVLALSPNQIADKAYSATYPKDEIQYDWTYDKTLINDSPAKGRISERIDEWNNRTDYDHREIKFIRYDNGSGVYNVINDNGNASAEFLTFGNNYGAGGIIHDNWLGDFYSIGQLIGQEYANNIFSSGLIVSNRIGDIVYNNTFSGDVNASTFSGHIYALIFNGGVGFSTFSGVVYNLTFSGDVYASTFSGDVNYSTFNGDVNNSTFSGGISSLTFNGNIKISTFSGDASSSTFSGNIYNSTFSGNVNSSTFIYTTNLQYISINGLVQNKTIDDTTYPFLFGTDYEKRIFQASDNNIYARYFNGTNDINVLIP